MSNRLVAVFTPVEDLPDPRIERTRAHDLFELVVVALCGTLASADTWTDIERFSQATTNICRLRRRRSSPQRPRPILKSPACAGT